MTTSTWKMILAGALFLGAAASSFLHAQRPAPDLILSNGKIITVDEKFTIAQAVAIRGDRVVAVGSNQAITPLAGPSTRNRLSSARVLARSALADPARDAACGRDS